VVEKNLMTKALSSLAVLCLGISLLTGCEAQKCDVPVGDGDQGTEEQQTTEGICLKSLKKFKGANPIERSAAWLPGSPISIDGVNGQIEVVQGSSNTVVATFHPFVIRAYDTSQDEILANLEHLEGTATGDAGGVSGAVEVRSRRNGTVPSTLGADITVEIPPTFDGVLTVHQNNGSTDIRFSGSATAVNLNSENGSSDVNVSPSATALDIFGDNGGLSVNVPAVPPGTESRTIHSGLGDVGLSFGSVPAGTKFSVMAFAPDGVVDTGNAESAGCTLVQPVNPGSKTVRCNGATDADPVYKVNADDLSDIALTF